MIDPNCGIFWTAGLEKGIGGVSRSNSELYRVHQFPKYSPTDNFGIRGVYQRAGVIGEFWVERWRVV